MVCLVIAISGLPYSGMSTLAKKVVDAYNEKLEKCDKIPFEEYKLRACHVGDLWAKLTEEKRGIRDARKRIRGFSLSNDENTNRILDNMLLEEITKGNVVADGRHAPVLCRRKYIPAYTILVLADIKELLGRAKSAGRTDVHLREQIADEKNMCNTLYHSKLVPPNFTAEDVRVYTERNELVPLYDKVVDTTNKSVDASFSDIIPGINKHIKMLVANYNFPINITL